MTTFGYVSPTGEPFTPGGRHPGRHTRLGGALGGLWALLFGAGWVALGIWMMGGVIAGNIAGPGETTGTGTVREVQRIEHTPGKSSSRTCEPVAEITVDGTAYTATTRYSTSPCDWKPGQAVSVVYSPGRVQETARVVATGGPIVMAVAFPALGLFPLAKGFWDLVRSVAGLGRYRRQGAV